MRTRSNNPFSTVTTSGLLLPIDLLARVAQGDPDLKGLKGKDFHLRSGERLNEAAARAWSQCLSAWKSFRKRFKALPASDIGTTTTRDEWLLPLFQELGYGRLQTKKALDFDGTEYPISHGWEKHIPIHLLSASLPLDRRTAGVSGAAARAPYSLMQELLNRSATHRWGFVTNGLKLYLLRDNAALARAANVEFDLEAMMDGEVYADFFLLFCLCHQSRVEIRGGGEEGNKPNPEDCWLEDWANQADQQGTRAREKLRDGVETSIKSLGAGFLTTRGNEALRARLSSGELSTQDFYRQLLRLVYRLLMLLVAEEKRSESGDNLLHPPGTSLEVRDRYARYYSVGRVRSLAYERRGTAHTDLYESLKVLFLKLRTGYEPLGIPGMGSFLFSDDSTPDLDDAFMANQDLLDAFRNLCYTDDTSARGGGIRRPVDFGNLGSEELGSVYESLLELHPLIETDEGPFTLGTAAGHERKTTGSYYTPTSLINCLLDSALDPVVHEAINVPDASEAERKLLDLKVCDPACGSGHFLIAAADRMAMHLARIRTGDDQPNTIDIQHAKRDIIGRCIYGVDMNPMAVELCKVSLWMEALEPGKPLSFLDHQIQCGNSLIGATPRLLAEGIPDAAFKPIEGDDNDVCKELKKRNKREREDYASGQGYLFEPVFKLGDLTGEFAKLTAANDDSLESIAVKREKYVELVKGTSYQNARLWADIWCAAFVWKKDESDLGWLCPTERKFRDVERRPVDINREVRKKVEQVSSKYRFFHWHLAFPEAFGQPTGDSIPENISTGWNGGFDIVLGNPPWDRMKLDSTEWFAFRDEDIANEGNGTKRREMIAKLEQSDAELFVEYTTALRDFEATSNLIRDSGFLKLGTKGEADLSTAFADLDTQLISQAGRVGVITSGTTLTGKSAIPLLNYWTESQRLERAWEFINTAKLFEIDSRQRYALLTITAPGTSARTCVAFEVTLPSEIPPVESALIFTDEEISLLSPNTKQFPKIQDRRTKELLVAITRSGQPLKTSSKNRFGFVTAFIFEENKSQRFFSREPADDGIAVLEGKSFHHFDHRFANYDGCSPSEVSNKSPKEVPLEMHVQPDYLGNTSPRLYADQIETDRRYQAKFSRPFAFAAREVSNSTNERTVICTVLPKYAVLHSAWIFDFNKLSNRDSTWLFSTLNSFVYDFTARQKVTTSHLSKYVWTQLPVLAPSSVAEDIRSRQLRSTIELCFTANDLYSFGSALGYDGPPFRWDENRRLQIRSELDAALFHLYLGKAEGWGVTNPSILSTFPTPRHAVEYIMDSFPIVRRKDEAKYDGEYRTKTTILRIYDEMAEAVRTGVYYQSSLNPPPGPPTDAQGNFIPFADWTDEIRELYRDVIHLDSAGDASVKRKQTATPAPATSVPGIAASAGGSFPATATQRLLVGLTADLVNRSSGVAETTLRELCYLASKPDLIAKLITSENRQSELDATVAELPSEFLQLDDSVAPWSKVLQTLGAANAIESVSTGKSTIIAAGESCGEVIAHFGTLPESYMQFVELAIKAYQRDAMEELDQPDAEAFQQARTQWAAETNG